MIFFEFETGYPVSVSGMITVPVSAQMYQTMISNIQHLQPNGDGTVCITPMQVQNFIQNSSLNNNNNNSNQNLNINTNTTTLTSCTISTNSNINHNNNNSIHQNHTKKYRRTRTNLKSCNNNIVRSQNNKCVIDNKNNDDNNNIKNEPTLNSKYQVQKHGEENVKQSYHARSIDTDGNVFHRLNKQQSQLNVNHKNSGSLIANEKTENRIDASDQNKNNTHSEVIKIECDNDVVAKATI